VHVGRMIINCLLFSDIDTDELDSDTKNVEEEVVEFFIKEEITVIE
jgi:translation initiation factor 3 subunit B